MKYEIGLKRTRAYLPIVVDEIVSETLTILATQCSHDVDLSGNQTGFVKAIDVYGNLYSFPNNTIKRIVTCVATKVHTEGKTVFVRHPLIWKFGGNGWEYKPSKLIFTAKTYIQSDIVYIYKNPEL